MKDNAVTESKELRDERLEEIMAEIREDNFCTRCGVDITTNELGYFRNLHAHGLEKPEKGPICFDCEGPMY